MKRLQKILRYTQWRRFENTIDKAKITCEKSNINVYDHFPQAGKMVDIGSGAKRKQIDKNGNEYWSARELMPLLEYTLWQRFSNVLKKAIENCKNSNYNALDHFINIDKMVNIGSNTTRNVLDYKLSRYACYLIVLNCDPRKKVIALAKTYFAIQTRIKQNISVW